MPSIILKVKKVPPVKKDLAGHVRISPDAEIIIRELQNKTGLTAYAVASQIIEQSKGNVEIVEEE